jgi:hypothetical protein
MPAEFEITVRTDTFVSAQAFKKVCNEANTLERGSNPDCFIEYPNKTPLTCTHDVGVS